MERTQEEIRLVLDAYHRELQKLNITSALPYPSHIPGILAMQQATHQHFPQNENNSVAAAVAVQTAQDLSLGSILRSKIINGITDEEKDKVEESVKHASSAFSLVKPKLEQVTAVQSTPSGSSANSPLSNTILPPVVSSNEDFAGSTTASPLQRIASITNSLISQPVTPTQQTSNQRPLKAVLPPITQQQFDIYNNLNTEDIVKRVRIL